MSDFLKIIGAPGVKPASKSPKEQFLEMMSAAIPKRMGLTDWQDMTGPYDAAPDRWDDRWTPTGFGVPGVPRSQAPAPGLVDVYGRPIPKDGLAPSETKTETKTETAPVAKNSSNGRSSTRTAPDGSTQTGTQTGLKPMTMEEANGLLGRVGLAGFNSTNLPGTGSYTVPNTGGETPRQAAPGQISPVQRGIQAGISADRAASGVNEAVLGGMKLGAEMDTGMTPAETSGLKFNPKNSGDERTIGEQYAPPTVIDAEEIQRRSSFLDAKDSMQGLRAIERDKGVIYAGGQYNMVNPNRGQGGQGDFVNISKAERDEVMKSNASAQAFADSYKARVAKSTSAPKPETESQSEPFAPPSLEYVPERPLQTNTETVSSPQYWDAPARRSQADFTDTPELDIEGLSEYRKLKDAVSGNPYIRS